MLMGSSLSSAAVVPVSRLPAWILPSSDSQAAQAQSRTLAFLGTLFLSREPDICLHPAPVCGLLYASAETSWHLDEEVAHPCQARVSDPELLISLACGPGFAWPEDQLAHHPLSSASPFHIRASQQPPS